MRRFGVCSSVRFISVWYACLSDWQRSDCTAAPLPTFSMRICSAVLSAFMPISPPSASISRTRCPFAVPPTEGLHAMKAILSRLSVSIAVLRPVRAQASAASQPA